jgi:L-fuculose-phosphate aldolase
MSDGDPAIQPRAGIVRACQEMLALRLTTGASGNISVRVADGMLITPSAVPYPLMRTEMLRHITLDGAALDGRTAPAPSTEWQLHAEVYRARPDVSAIVHAHPPHATALACLRRSIPRFHYMVAVAGGGDVPCTAYATPGTAALAHAAVAVLRERDACLLANHGIVAVATTVERALALAVQVETLAEQYCIAIAAGEPVLLTDGEMTEALRAVRNYTASQD